MRSLPNFRGRGATARGGGGGGGGGGFRAVGTEGGIEFCEYAVWYSCCDSDRDLFLRFFFDLPLEPFVGI